MMSEKVRDVQRLCSKCDCGKCQRRYFFGTCVNFLVLAPVVLLMVIGGLGGLIDIVQWLWGVF